MRTSAPQESANPGISRGTVMGPQKHGRWGLLLSLFVVLPAMVWLVITKSLPNVLADRWPDTALMLNPDNPAALLVRAEELRGRLLKLLTVEAGGGAASGQGGGKRSGAGARSEDPVRTNSSPSSGREALRAQIRAIAEHVIRVDPLNSRAFRLLGEVTADRDSARELMKAAVARSRRETLALFWLFNDSLQRNEVDAAVAYGDILLTTRPGIEQVVVPFLGSLADTPVGRAALVDKLSKQPGWRGWFFELLPNAVRDLRSPLMLMLALKKAGQPASGREQGAYLEALLRKQQPNLAYSTWLQLLSKSELAKVGAVNNAGFDEKPSGQPFDWKFSRQSNAIAELSAAPHTPKGQSLHIQFGRGRVKVPEVGQILVLNPGHYRISGLVQGAISGRRGMRWQVGCLSGDKVVAGESEMLLGRFPSWRRFAFEASVPEDGSCRGQRLRLFHDARSASEELIAGGVWFDEIRIEPIETRTDEEGRAAGTTVRQ